MRIVKTAFIGLFLTLGIHACSGVDDSNDNNRQDGAECLDATQCASGICTDRVCTSDTSGSRTAADAGTDDAGATP